MLVKYIGHGDMISSDWNGKRYVFSKSRPLVDIPVGLYDNIKASNFILKADIVPVDVSIDVKKEPKKSRKVRKVIK